MRWMIRLAALGCFVFLVLQFVRPELMNPPVTAEIQAPPEVKAILKNSCYSCHSNETTLPWFDQVVPAYWLVHHDVNEAREHLNFSEIGKLPPAVQRATLFEAITRLPWYRITRAEARLLDRFAGRIVSAFSDPLTLVELGCDMFIEVGPKRALTGMMRELAPGTAAVAVATPAAVSELSVSS